MERNKLLIDGNKLSLSEVELFIYNKVKVELTADSVKAVKKARALVEKWLEEDEVIYGVTTGFGQFSDVRISKDDIETLQENLIASHCAGVGDPLPPFIVKLMMLFRLNHLAKGYSGIRVETLDVLIGMINNNIIPVIPSQGSVGSSGDLAPLSHLVYAMMGNGDVRVMEDCTPLTEGTPKIQSAKSALKKYGISPVILKAKEGIALINGTQMMLAFAAYSCIRAKEIVKLADMSASLSHEGLRATDKAFDKRIHKLRPYKGQLDSAENMLKLIKGSGIRKSHLTDDPRVQDSYSIRCIPQVHGAARDTVDFVCRQIEIELNAVTDNPLVFPDDGEHLEGGNFHGEPIAMPMDYLKIALAELANISERRTERLLNSDLSGLPPFLAKNGGLNSGYMIAQYTSAALVSENKVLCHPASVDSIPTSANKEDLNSMGSIAARNCYSVLRNVETVLAIEFLTAAQSIEFLKPLKCGNGTTIIYNTIREVVPPPERDRHLSGDINTVLKLVRNNSLTGALQETIKLK